MDWRKYFLSHSWWGKLLGGICGYMLARSVGALFGILIGNLFDRGIILHILRPHHAYYSEQNKQIQLLFFSTTFAVMGYIAKSDGRVSEQEITVAQQLMQTLRLSRKQKKQAQFYFTEGKQHTYNFQQSLSDLLSGCRGNPELLNLFMDIQYRAAMKGGFSAAKQHALNMICTQLGFAQLYKQQAYYADATYTASDYTNYKTQSHVNDPTRSLDKAYALLEISASSNKQEIKRAYRRLISRNHPDKMIAKGLPESMIKLANNKTQAITKAYEQIAQSRGW